MHGLDRHYPPWKAPSEDGKPVIWPQPDELLKQTVENHKRLSSAYSVKLSGVPLPQVRRALRQSLGHDIAQPLIATGHQSELYHPGVWAKNALIDAVARKLCGQAFHVVVDTDSPKHLHVRWPGQSIPITDDPAVASAAWSSLLSSPSRAHLDHIQSRFDEARHDWDFQPMLPKVIDLLRRDGTASLSLSAGLTSAMHELDWSLGLRHHALLGSPLWNDEPFLLFAHDLVSNAESMASHYNAALDGYRDASGITSHMRPMPDLYVGDEAIEVPFWLDDLHAGRRTRPCVYKCDRGFVLKLTSGDEFLFEPSIGDWEAARRLQKWLASTRHRLSPRALTLTMFVRMVMCDQFTHGIGGGRYDQVTDRLIASHYGIEPPHFSVTTITMYFPSALGVERVCLPCVKQEGHRLRHRLLGQRKRELVAAIDALPRRSAQRSATFFQMHHEIGQALARSDQWQRMQGRLRDTQAQFKLEQTLFDREIFYALQPETRLKRAIELYRGQLTGKSVS
jgi:hypothetical protein